ncbi:MAG TPA: hypothetical protein VIK15_06785 [Candidatus Anoxymicrobiaceae bacterium]
MASSREQVLAGLRKARINKYVYFGAGLGLFVLSILLVVLFVARKHDWGALVLAPIGVVFGVIMLYQSRHMSREVEALQETLGEDSLSGEELADDEPTEPAEPFAPRPTADRSLDRDRDSDGHGQQGDDPGEP